MLKKRILEAVEQGDIAALYLIEPEAAENFDEEQLGRFYANILDLALENLTDALESKRRLSFENAQDICTIKALYEYALEHFDASKTHDASALFEILSGLSDNREFSQAMKKHQDGTKNMKNLEQFLEQIADLEATEKSGTFYISEFR